MSDFEKIRNERLLRLADFLEKLPPERFSYHHWVGSNWAGKQDLSCGTTACALGWAASMPEFQELGLRLRKTRTWELPVVCMEEDSDPQSFTSPVNAARAVFMLERHEAEYLFFPEDDTYKYSPGEVARKIRNWVRTGEKVSDEGLGIIHE